MTENEKKCKKCGGSLIQKSTKRTAEQLKKAYYYTAYYFCPRCNKLYHDEKFKVENHLTPSFLSASSGAKPSREAPVVALSLPAGRQSQPAQTKEEYDVEIWTDGACVFNGQPNAKAAWAFVSGQTEKAGLVDGKQTNNVAEALAIYYALFWAAEQGYKRIKIYSDSLITINNIPKDPRLVKNNTEIFEDIARIINNLELTVTLEKVLGHSGDENNERADKLANQLAAKGE